MLPTRLRAYAVRRCAEIGMIEDLDEDQEKPTIKDGFSDTWLTRRRTWDEKARTLRVYLWMTVSNGSYAHWRQTFMPH